MNQEMIDKLEDYLGYLIDYFENNAKNCLEKIAILEKLNELVFWLQMYQDKYL